MRPIIPFITIQAIYLSALMRVLFRFASSTEQGIKLTKEKREKKKSAACVRLLQITYYLLLFIYSSIYYWNFETLRNNFTKFSHLQLLSCFPFYILGTNRDFGDKLHNYFTISCLRYKVSLR